MPKLQGLRVLCTTPRGVASLLLVILCALVTFASVDFEAVSKGPQRSLEWLLGSDPRGILSKAATKPATKEHVWESPRSQPGLIPPSQLPENVSSNVEARQENSTAAWASGELDHGDMEPEISPTSVELGDLDMESEIESASGEELDDFSVNLELEEEDNEALAPVPTVEFAGSDDWENQTDVLRRSENLADPKNSDGTASTEWDYDVCLLVNVGRRAMRSAPPCLPYGELYRLFNAVKGAAREEVRDRKVFVGADVSVIFCKMVRDALGPEVECSNFNRVWRTKKCKHLLVAETKKYAAQPSLTDVRRAKRFVWETVEAVDVDTPDPSRAPPPIPESEWRPTIVTAFSSNHAEVGLLLLRSLGRVAVRQQQFNVSLLVWTMNDFPKVASRALDCVVKELETVYRVPTEVRAFNFGAWPEWMRINQKLGYNGGRGEYAWKAVMIHTVLVERGFVYWADAGDRFKTVEGLTLTLQSVKRKGFASRLSSGRVKQWCHPMQLEYFRANVPRILRFRNCDASGIGFTLHAYNTLARPWYECSITRQCIAPDGSSRRNHRQDQSALTLLVALTGSKCAGVDDGIRKNLDHQPGSYTLGIEPTKCYKDPLKIKWQ